MSQNIHVSSGVSSRDLPRDAGRDSDLQVPALLPGQEDQSAYPVISSGVLRQTHRGHKARVRNMIAVIEPESVTSGPL